MAYGVVSVLPNMALPLISGSDERPSAAKTVPSPLLAGLSRDCRRRGRRFRPGRRPSLLYRHTPGHGHPGLPGPGQPGPALPLASLARAAPARPSSPACCWWASCKCGEASSLIFDMHSEYGWSGQDSDRDRQVKGLKQLFPSPGFHLHPGRGQFERSRRRGSSPDELVKIGYGEIEPEDIELLKDNLNLSDVAASAAFNLKQRFGGNWLGEFLERGGADLGELADELGVNRAALGSLHNRLSRFRRFPFLEDGNRHNAAATIIEHLERGKHVVLEFGRYGAGFERLHPGEQPAFPPHSRAVRGVEGSGRGRPGQRPQAPGHRHRRGPTASSVPPLPLRLPSPTSPANCASTT